MMPCYQAVVLLALLFPAQLFAQAHSALRDLNAHCPFTPPVSLAAWQTRSDDLRLQLQVALGLHPAAELEAVAPKIYGRIERTDYTIEKVTFESLPGFHVTGSLYRPANLAADARVPAVLAPHGHWTNARFYDEKPAAIKELLATGAERFENAARNHIQARCVQLARMGCMVLHWDMIGYCDSVQISFDRAHRFANQPSEVEVSDEGWLLFSPLAESHSQSILGLQSLAVTRAVDMLLTLPEVDPNRIAISGASGGGTQTFLGAALDPRIAVAFPAVMVSTGMQGGCTCENACLLRTGTGNVEIAALIAPRPLGMTAANDWTKTMPEDGFPELQKLYSLFDAKKNVALFPATHFPHNFNHVSRVALYGWINDHFKLGLDKPILERDFDIALKEELTVWDTDHPTPESGDAFERKLMKLWAEIIHSQLKGLLQGDAQQVKQLAKILQEGWRVSLGLTATQLQQPTSVTTETGIRFTSAQLPAWTLRNSSPLQSSKESLQPAEPSSQETSHDAIAESWTQSAEDLRIEVNVNGATQNYFFELAGQSSDDRGATTTKWQAIVENPRLAAAYTFGYNVPLFGQRAQQIGLTLLWLATEHPQEPITVIGGGADAALAAAGVFIARELATKEQKIENRVQLKIKPGDFAFSKIGSIRDPNFLPGSARYLDLPGLVACSAAKVEIIAADTAPYQQLLPLIRELGGQCELASPGN